MSHIHIPDGVLPFWLWGGGWLITLGLLAIASKVSARSEVRRKVPLLAVVSSVMLVAMSSEIVPIAYHVNLTVLGGVLLGPVLGVIAAFIAEVVLAMLGHGGVTVLGLNTLLIAAEMALGWALVRAFLRLGRKRSVKSVRVAAFAATVLTLLTTTTLLVGIVAISGGGAASARESGALDPATLEFANPFAEGAVSVGLFAGGEDAEPTEDSGPAGGSVRRFAAVVYTLGPIGWILEALVTAAILGYIFRMRPGLIDEGLLAAGYRPPAGDEGVGH